MMTPITRKEKYINQIVGGGDTAPETPQTREEFFFAEILGEVVAPSPVTRVEKYLSAIARQYSGDLPTPITRIEYFLARAAGMEIETPIPITREEMLWDTYIPIKTIEGIPPLTFKAKKAGTLNNYRIYGNTVNGENVGDLITEGEHAGEYSVPVTVTNGTDTETTNLYLPEPIKMVGDEAEYIDYAEQKQHRVRKNLLQNTATSRTTINGVTFTVNSDGSIVCDGQASPSTATLIFSEFLVPSGAYILTGCPNGGSERRTYKMLLFINGAWFANDMGSGANFTLTKTSTVSVRIDIYNGYTCNNLTFYPMIRKADIEDDTYEPYIENTDVDVILPGIAVTAGTNTLAVGTEVQPSDVYIKYEGAQ